MTTAASSAPSGSAPPDRYLRRLLAASRPGSGRLALAVLSGAGALLASIGLIGTAAWLIARASQQPPILDLSVAVVAVRFFGVIRPVLRYLERLVSHDATFRTLRDVRASVYERLVPLTPARLGTRRRGELLAGVVSDVEAVEDLQLRIVEPVAVAAVVSAATVGFAAWLLPSAAVVLAAAFLVAGVAAPLTAAVVSRRSVAALAPRRAELATAVVDLVTGAPDLIATGAAGAQLRQIDRLDAELTAVARRTAWATGLGAALAALAAGAAVWASAVVGTVAVRSGNLTGVTLAVVVLVPLAAFEAFAPLPQAAVLVAHVRASAGRLFRLLDAEPAVRDPASPAALPGPPYPVQLRDVRVRWTPDAPWVLDGLSLDLPAGRRIAVVGESGSGKSTLGAVLLRFLTAEGGSVLLGGTDTALLAGDDVRRVVGLVADDAHVFDSTLRANLALADPAATDEQLVAAIRQAHLGGWFDGLPEGLGTWLGPAGALLSGGEQRRLALARALLADQPVLVLDEPTEGLDAATAEAVVGDLLAGASRRTVLLLTHRPEGLQHVDEIYEMRDGRLHRRGGGLTPRG